jgi:hypothetical protein
VFSTNRSEKINFVSEFINTSAFNHDKAIKMNDILSFSEIKERFVSEWVLIGDPETDEDLNIKKGKTLWHSKDRDEVYRKAREIQPAHSAIIYTGKLPDNVAVIL